MKLLIFIVFLILSACSKPKTVLICGDHICVNNKEAEQYFEKNLTLEVKIISDKKPEITDLVQLNLNRNSKNSRKISINEKQNTNKKIRNLSNKEIKKIKKEVKVRNKNNNKNDLTTIKKKSEKLITKKQNVKKNNKVNLRDNKLDKNFKKDNIKIKQKVADVCLIVNKCSIDEISKYLIDEYKNKPFPDITIRE